MNGHIIGPLRNCALGEAIRDLTDAHDFVVSRCCVWQRDASFPSNDWGIQIKRRMVSLSGAARPSLIGKDDDSLPELANILASVERMLATLRWFSTQPEYAACRVLVCHPATSGKAGENDLVLADSSGRVCARCEVCDVVPACANQNGKEKSDLEVLGCVDTVPPDDVRRFISTSAEFAGALMASKRDWVRKFHRYLRVGAVAECGTTILEVVSPPGSEIHTEIEPKLIIEAGLTAMGSPPDHSRRSVVNGPL